jgi:glycerol uptake facilitator-like aquaporin
VSTKDHNEAVAGIHLSLGGFLVLTLVIGPFLLKRDLGRHPDQIPIFVIVFVVLLALAVLLISTALAMNKKKPVGRKLALWAAPFLFLMFWPGGIYSWWFLHSDGAKQMYGVKEDE